MIIDAERLLWRPDSDSDSQGRQAVSGVLKTEDLAGHYQATEHGAQLMERT
jgi:hypothetical protein